MIDTGEAGVGVAESGCELAVSMFVVTVLAQKDLTWVFKLFGFGFWNLM